MSDDEQEQEPVSSSTTEDDLSKCSYPHMFVQYEPQPPRNAQVLLHEQCHSPNYECDNSTTAQASAIQARSDSSSSSYGERQDNHAREYHDSDALAAPGPSSLTFSVENECDQDVLSTRDPLDVRLENLWSIESWDPLATTGQLQIPSLAPLSQGSSPSHSSVQPSVSSFQQYPDLPPLVPIKKSQGEFYSAIGNKMKASSSKPKTGKRKISIDEDYYPSSEDEDSDEYERVRLAPKRSKNKYGSKRMVSDDTLEFADDGDLEIYNYRMQAYYESMGDSANQDAGDDSNEEDGEGSNFVWVTNDFKMPVNTWDKLYPYQQEGVRWLYTLHIKDTGGILGDEMGLGKTVQLITFLLGIEYNKISYGRWIGLGPTLIVCPATVMHQWVRHFHEWAPEFRVGVLHVSTTFGGTMPQLVKEIYEYKGIVIVTYQGVLKHQHLIENYKWHYVILDEGHKIRTPTAKVTIIVKRLLTKHRIVLTGSPMQNNLIELWSLFDFTNHGLLGTQQTFEEHFSKPITRGGYENASAAQKQIGLTIATSLKNLINPFILRRAKKEVQDDICLPAKSEQVLFCALSDEQKRMYKDFLLSERVGSILGKGRNWFADATTRSNVLVAITTLRKLCNHPDLYLRDAMDTADDEDRNESPNFDARFFYKRSGKMTVVSALLKIWKRQGHRVLLFTQGRATLNILHHFLDKNGYPHLKMDGSTPVSARQSMIDHFNKDTKYFVFLLTTRVGGLGINLTGANRVIIFDPDWNPATDSQAKERAWRIGQLKDVTIYRLLSVGTIEEKIYQRQVWKQLLGDKVLVDPRADKHIFRSSDLFDLFSLNETESNPETANIFQDAQVKIPEVVKAEKPVEVFSEEKIKEMRALAHKIALSFPQKKPTMYEQELADERAKKMEEKEKLKALSAPELIQLNREKANTREDPSLNRVDDAVTLASFSEALEYTGATSRLHTELVQGKKKPKDAADKTNELKLKMKMKSANGDAKNQPSTSSVGDESSKKKKEKKLSKKASDEVGYKTYIDHSGAVDDVKVDGLVKTEIKIRRKGKVEPVESQDDYVLRSLFKKANVSGVLEHDTVVQGTSRGTLKLQLEAEERARKSMEALRRSRLDNSQWEN